MYNFYILHVSHVIEYIYNIYKASVSPGSLSTADYALFLVTRSSLHGYLYSLPVTVENVCCLSVVTETCFLNRWLAMNTRIYSLLQERVFGEPLASNGPPLWLHYSGFQASCHNTFMLHRENSTFTFYLNVCSYQVSSLSFFIDVNCIHVYITWMQICICKSNFVLVLCFQPRT
jgi:hypothetical protein